MTRNAPFLDPLVQVFFLKGDLKSNNRNDVEFVVDHAVKAFTAPLQVILMTLSLFDCAPIALERVGLDLCKVSSTKKRKMKNLVDFKIMSINKRVWCTQSNRNRCKYRNSLLHQPVLKLILL